jgi:integrase
LVSLNRGDRIRTCDLVLPKLADGKVMRKEEHTWQEAMERFRIQKSQHGAAIKAITWENQYAPVLGMAVELLSSGKPPGSPADLLDACLRDWQPGSRTRQIRAQSLAQFLRYCVERLHFPDLWRPPLSLQQHIGAPTRESAAGSRKGHPFSDLEILGLIDSLPLDQAGQRWADAVKLMAELGLRPIELQHLSVRQDRTSGRPLWWCAYRKRSGGGMTEPRWIHPLPLTDWDGRRQDWQLLERWQAGAITLPPLGSDTGTAADAIGTYLKRKKGWQELRDRMAARGERAVPYSFRHGYSLRGHQLGIDPGSMALSMGHSLEVHLRSYPWASGRSTAAAFERALNSSTEATPSL